jgi:hypothetical protein
LPFLQHLSLLLLYKDSKEKYCTLSWVPGTTNPNSCLQDILFKKGILSFYQLQFLISTGLDINQHYSTEPYPGIEGYCPLHLAAKYQNISMVPRLMFFGADTQKKDLQNQETPFQKALKYGFFKTCALLEPQKAAAITIQRAWRS